MDQNIINRNTRVRDGLTLSELRPVLRVAFGARSDYEELAQRYGNSVAFNGLLSWVPAVAPRRFAAIVLGFGLGDQPPLTRAELAECVGYSEGRLKVALGASLGDKSCKGSLGDAHRFIEDRLSLALVGNRLSAELGLSVRVWRPLVEGCWYVTPIGPTRIRTPQELCQKTEAELLDYNNIGPRTIQDVIIPALASRGLMLKEG